MKVTVTSPSFCKDPDLRKELLSHFPNAKLNDAGQKLGDQTLADFLADTTHAIIGTEQIHRQVLSQLPQLKVISKFGVGLDNINFKDCDQLGVQVRHSQGVNKRSVSELTLCFLLGLFRNVFVTSKDLATGHWNKSGGTQLSGKAIGIVGLGNIGQDLVALLKPFGCRILACDIADRVDFAAKNQVQLISLNSLLNQSDAVTIHVPLKEDTRRLISTTEIQAMKKGAFLINTARGGIVDEAAAKLALKSGQLGGLAFDVYQEEPLQDSELWSLSRTALTPHIGGNAKEAVMAMGMAAIQNLLK